MTPANGFLLRWWLWVTVAESVGFLAPAAVAASVAQSHPEFSMVSFVCAGFVEGAVLGFAQARVLKQELPLLSVRGWTARTAVAASIAWLLGLAPSEFYPVWQEWPPAVQLAAAIAGGLLLLCSLGLAQLPELRRHVAGSGWWVAGSAAAWFAGLGVFFAVATPLWEEGQPRALTVGIGIGAGVLMAASAALISGHVMARLLKAVSRGSLHVS